MFKSEDSLSDQFEEKQLRQIKKWPQLDNGDMPFSDICQAGCVWNKNLKYRIVFPKEC